MRVLDILLFMGELGARYREKDVPLIESYFSKMIADGRVIAIYSNGIPHAILAFSICNDMVKYYQKDTWDYAPHNPYGHVIYVEKLVSKKWDKDLRKQFQHNILLRYPNVDTAIWHRYGRHGDRQVMYKRRLSDVRNQDIEQQAV